MFRKKNTSASVYAGLFLLMVDSSFYRGRSGYTCSINSNLSYYYSFNETNSYILYSKNLGDETCCSSRIFVENLELPSEYYIVNSNKEISYMHSLWFECYRKIYEIEALNNTLCARLENMKAHCKHVLVDANVFSRLDSGKRVSTSNILKSIFSYLGIIGIAKHYNCDKDHIDNNNLFRDKRDFLYDRFIQINNSFKSIFSELSVSIYARRVS